MEVTGIQSLVRTYIPTHQYGGNLLMAEDAKNGLGVHVPVTFTGTQLSEITEFRLGKNERYQANTLSCDLGDEKFYYLCAEGEKVYLLKKSVAEDPNDEKLLFKIKRVPHLHKHEDGQGWHFDWHNDEHYWTIMSLSTGMFLASNEEGHAFMKRVREDDHEQDREIWFHFIPSKHEATMTFSCNYDLSIELKASLYRQTSEVEAC